MSELEWIRVSKRHPCPCCSHFTWCSYSPSENLLVCMRTPSDKPCKSGGWLHPLDGEALATLPKKEWRPPVPVIDFTGHALTCVEALTHPEVLANMLHVSERALERLQAGWDTERQAYTFPMRFPQEKIIGIQLRYPDRKLAITGSRNGLFWPEGVEIEDELLILCEGYSDCAALLDLGYAAIGRAGCQGCVQMITSVLQQRRRHVVIMADHDMPKQRPDGTVWRPGQDGANQLAAAIRPHVRSVKVVKPPFNKDIRGWVQRGASRVAVDALIANTRFK